jgi:XTP/dITP diphosphohydrolase
MKRLLIATTNPAKLAEYRLLLSSFELELISPDEAGIRDTPAETGATFADNALLKARHYFARSGLPTLADDGGLEVDALGGAPGLKSHRWLGEGPSDDRALVDEVIRRMSGVEETRRTARLRAAIALVYRENGAVSERVAEAAIEGVIARRAYSRIRPGFPYRSVMFLPERGRYLAELGDEEEARISQRRIALEKLRDELQRIAARASAA